MPAPTITEWAAVCDAVSEMNEPPIRTCPQCHALAYETPRHVFQCARCGEIDRREELRDRA